MRRIYGLRGSLALAIMQRSGAEEDAALGYFGDAGAADGGGGTGDDAVESAPEIHRERYERGQQSVERVRQLLGSLVAGYRMGLQRIERILVQYDLEPIPAAGTLFDPERMEVLEAVENTGRPTGEVLEEVRRGYLWRGRVFRFAQVRVARS